MISFTIFFQNPDPSCSFLKRERAGRKGAGLYREESEEGGGHVYNRQKGRGA